MPDWTDFHRDWPTVRAERGRVEIPTTWVALACEVLRTPAPGMAALTLANEVLWVSEGKAPEPNLAKTGTPPSGQVAEHQAARLRAAGVQRVTHGRHCLCSSCAREDWTNPVFTCGMHGADCPSKYQPWARPGSLVRVGLDGTVVVVHTPGMANPMQPKETP